jgi:hypothetical protein
MLCRTKSIWSHAENNILQKLDVLTRINEHGKPLFLNKQIGATRWVPKDYPTNSVNELVYKIYW